MTQFPALTALVIRKEDKPFGIQGLKEHHSRRDRPGGTDGRNSHSVGIQKMGLGGLGEPVMEKVEGVLGCGLFEQFVVGILPVELGDGRLFHDPNFA